jgi:hypothetical protein
MRPSFDAIVTAEAGSAVPTFNPGGAIEESAVPGPIIKRGRAQVLTAGSHFNGRGDGI